MAGRGIDDWIVFKNASWFAIFAWISRGIWVVVGGTVVVGLGVVVVLLVVVVVLVVVVGLWVVVVGGSVVVVVVVIGTAFFTSPPFFWYFEKSYSLCLAVKSLLGDSKDFAKPEGDGGAFFGTTVVADLSRISSFCCESAGDRVSFLGSCSSAFVSAKSGWKNGSSYNILGTLTLADTSSDFVMIGFEKPDGDGRIRTPLTGFRDSWVCWVGSGTSSIRLITIWFWLSSRTLRLSWGCPSSVLYVFGVPQWIGAMTSWTEDDFESNAIEFPNAGTWEICE